MGVYEDLQNRWKTCEEYLGPVPTDFKLSKEKAEVVIVCESPSEDEVDETNQRPIRPANGTTGGNLTKALRMFHPEGTSATRDDLPKLGYYVTNLVGFRADAGLKKRGLNRNQRRPIINANLTSAWHIEAVQDSIIEELASVVNANPSVKILFACGKYACLANIVTKIVGDLRFAATDWIQARHPSVWWPCHYALIIPANWETMIKLNSWGIYQGCSRLEDLRPKLKTKPPSTQSKGRMG